MKIILVLAPVIGLAWGAATHKIKTGLIAGIVVGAGNFILWHVYNAITNRLGLDTVLNFEVNLGLFVLVGIALGAAITYFRRRDEVNSATEQMPEQHKTSVKESTTKHRR